jgi:general secretion pathway protein E
LAVVDAQSLTSYLVENSFVSEKDISDLNSLEAGNNKGALLVQMGIISETDLSLAHSQRLSIPFISKADFPEEALLENILAYKYLKHNLILPIEITDDFLTVAVANPDNDNIEKALRLASGMKIKIGVSKESDILESLEQLYGLGRSQMNQILDSVENLDDTISQDDIAHLKDMASEAPVVKLVNLIFKKAVELQASDIHIEPFANDLKIRYRVDGVLLASESPSSAMQAAIISRIKIMANLDIAERRLPQDGRLQIRLQGISTDLRVSTAPTVFGESLVIRLLYKENRSFNFNHLGFEREQLAQYHSLLDLPHGVVLVTGPTGSGKTTSLYAGLNHLNESTRKIITVEDPVEYQLEGINQIQVKPQIDLTFATALRSIVRQDPDVILIGEMRDRETAEIAVQSALTGHLVLSTLHTNDAASSIMRLQDLGIPNYLINTVLNGVLAQRLVRRLCQHCRSPYSVSRENLSGLGLADFLSLIDKGASEIELFRAQGCEQCNGTGYSGRIALIEVLHMNDKLRELVLQRTDSHQLSQFAASEGMQTLFQDGLNKALKGVTSIEEVWRVTQI